MTPKQQRAKIANWNRFRIRGVQFFMERLYRHGYLTRKESIRIRTLLDRAETRIIKRLRDENSKTNTTKGTPLQ